MAKYEYIAGPRKGNVGREKYYSRNNVNFVQEASKYIPINSQWIKKEQFKKYVLSLLKDDIPQVYILDDLPEKINPYALLFVKNGDLIDMYVDKDGVRTKIEISKEEEETKLYHHNIFLTNNNRAVIHISLITKVSAGMTFNTLNNELSLRGCTNELNGYPSEGEGPSGGFVECVFSTQNGVYVCYHNFTHKSTRPLTDWSTIMHDYIYQIN